MASISGTEARQLLLDSYRAAVAAADPLKIVPPHLPPAPQGRTLVIGAGTRLLGYGPTRPVFVLADNTPGYQDGDNKYMLHFVSDRPRPGENLWHARVVALNQQDRDRAGEYLVVSPPEAADPLGSCLS